MAYQDSLKYYRDLKNAMDTVLEEGRELGRQEGWELGRLQEKRLIALQMKQVGLPVNQIAALTQLTEGEITAL